MPFEYNVLLGGAGAPQFGGGAGIHKEEFNLNFNMKTSKRDATSTGGGGGTGFGGTMTTTTNATMTAGGAGDLCAPPQRLTIAELSAKISYPPRKKKVPRLEPLATDVGRRALELFHLQKYGYLSGNTSRGNSAGTATTTNRAAAAFQQQQRQVLQSEKQKYAKQFSMASPVSAVGNSALNHHNNNTKNAAASSAAGMVAGSGAAAAASLLLGNSALLSMSGGVLSSHSGASGPTGANLNANPNTNYLKDIRVRVPLDQLSEVTPQRLDAELTHYLECIATSAPEADIILSSPSSHASPTVVAAGYSINASMVAGLRENAFLFYVTAMILKIKERFEDSVDYYSKALSRDPMLSGAYLGRAECYTQLNQPSDALAEYKKYMQLEPVTKDLLVMAGKSALDAEDEVDEAERLFKACLAIPSPATAAAATDGVVESSSAGGNSGIDNDSYALYNLGEVEERRGDTAKAKAYYAQVQPSFAKPYFTQGRIEFSRENYAVALRLFEAVAKVLKDTVSVHLCLADTYTALGAEFSLCALTCLSKALELPEVPRPVQNNNTSISAAGELALRFGRLEETQMMVGAAADADDSSDLADAPVYMHWEPTLLRRGLLYADILGDLDSAVKDFTLCLAQNPKNPDALLARARVALTRQADGDEDTAVADYLSLTALQDVPLDVKAAPYQTLGLYYEGKQDYVRAGRFLALAMVAGSIPPERSFYRCAGHAIVAQGPDDTPRPYAPRGWMSKHDDQAGAAGGSGGKRGHSPGTAAAINAPTALQLGSNPQSLAATMTISGAAATAGSPLLAATTTAAAERSIPVPPASYTLMDGYYVDLRMHEPTMHREDEMSFIETWGPFRQALEKQKEETENARLGKNKKRR